MDIALPPELKRFVSDVNRDGRCADEADAGDFVEFTAPDIAAAGRAELHRRRDG